MSPKIKTWLANNYLAILIIIFAIAGFYASFTLSVEKLEILKDAGKSLNCDINSVFSCGIVMRNSASEINGIPWSYVGVAGYPAVMLLGLVLIERQKISRWLAGLVTVGAFGAFALSTYFMWLTAYVIGAFCPWCITSAVSSTCIFFLILSHNFMYNNYELEEETAAKIQKKLRQGWGYVITIAWFLIMLAVEWYPFYMNSL
ncbi:MAG: hypothetical protein OHK0017_11790 [Patescibacteria group bacterium]